VWLDDGKPTRYLRCRTCGTVYASPRASRASRHAQIDSTFGVGTISERNAASRRPALAAEAEVIKRFIPSGTLLDIGCDLGDFFPFFPSPTWERFGVELSCSAASYASKTYAAQVHAGTLEAANYPSRSFDVVTMIDMLFYLDDPVAELQTVARVLRPGGLLGIEIPGLSYTLLRNKGLLCLLIDGEWSRLRTDSSYLYWFSMSGLSKLLKQCGFTPCYWEAVSSPVRTSLAQILSMLYGSSMRRISGRWPRSLAWAPKYLCLARLAVDV
jgi:SAM-dependent methyltransferase